MGRIKTLATIVLVSAATIVGGGVAIKTCSSFPEYSVPGQEQVMGKISYEQAILNPSLRQQYLDQILAKKDDLGDPLWNSFERLVYDPGFEKLSAHARPFGIERKLTSERILASTIHINQLKGKKQPSFFSERCFSYLTNEDELLACIDNESVHAYISETHQLPPYVLGRGYDYKTTGKESSRVERLALEAISFDVQFHNIMVKKRNVSNKFKQECGKTYIDIYKELEQIAKQDNEDSGLAKSILKVLRFKIK